jgi:chromosome segregation ATPase
MDTKKEVLDQLIVAEVNLRDSHSKKKRKKHVVEILPAENQLEKLQAELRGLEEQLIAERKVLDKVLNEPGVLHKEAQSITKKLDTAKADREKLIKELDLILSEEKKNIYPGDAEAAIKKYGLIIQANLLIKKDKKYLDRIKIIILEQEIKNATSLLNEELSSINSKYGQLPKGIASNPSIKEKLEEVHKVLEDYPVQPGQMQAQKESVERTYSKIKKIGEQLNLLVDSVEKKIIDNTQDAKDQLEYKIIEVKDKLKKIEANEKYKLDGIDDINKKLERVEEHIKRLDGNLKSKIFDTDSIKDIKDRGLTLLGDIQLTLKSRIEIVNKLFTGKMTKLENRLTLLIPHLHEKEPFLNELKNQLKKLKNNSRSNDTQLSIQDFDELSQIEKSIKENELFLNEINRRRKSNEAEVFHTMIKEISKEIVDIAKESSHDSSTLISILNPIKKDLDIFFNNYIYCKQTKTEFITNSTAVIERNVQGNLSKLTTDVSCFLLEIWRILMQRLYSWLKTQFFHQDFRPHFFANKTEINVANAAENAYKTLKKLEKDLKTDTLRPDTI